MNGRPNRVELELEMIKAAFSNFSDIVWMRPKTGTYQPSISSWNSANVVGARNRHDSKLDIKIIKTKYLKQ